MAVCGEPDGARPVVGVAHRRGRALLAPQLPSPALISPWEETSCGPSCRWRTVDAPCARMGGPGLSLRPILDPSLCCPREPDLLKIVPLLPPCAAPIGAPLTFLEVGGPQHGPPPLRPPPPAPPPPPRAPHPPPPPPPLPPPRPPLPPLLPPPPRGPGIRLQDSVLLPAPHPTPPLPSHRKQRRRMPRAPGTCDSIWPGSRSHPQACRGAGGRPGVSRQQPCGCGGGKSGEQATSRDPPPAPGSQPGPSTCPSTLLARGQEAGPATPEGVLALPLRDGEMEDRRGVMSRGPPESQGPAQPSGEATEGSGSEKCFWENLPRIAPS